MQMSEARHDIARAVELARTEAVILERNGHAAAVLISPARYDELMTAIEDAEDIAAMDASLAEDAPHPFPGRTSKPNSDGTDAIADEIRLAATLARTKTPAVHLTWAPTPPTAAERSTIAKGTPSPRSGFAHSGARTLNRWNPHPPSTKLPSWNNPNRAPAGESAPSRRSTMYSCPDIRDASTWSFAARTTGRVIVRTPADLGLPDAMLTTVKNDLEQMTADEFFDEWKMPVV